MHSPTQEEPIWRLNDLIVRTNSRVAARWNLGTYTTHDIAKIRVVNYGTQPETPLRDILKDRPEYEHYLLETP